MLRLRFDNTRTVILLCRLGAQHKQGSTPTRWSETLKRYKTRLDISLCKLIYPRLVIIHSLKKDDSIMFLPADEGRVTVILNKKEQEEKCQQPLRDENTYKKLKGDSTKKIKGELVRV